jgi:hypothetical protein
MLKFHTCSWLFDIEGRCALEVVGLLDSAFIHAAPPTSFKQRKRGTRAVVATVQRGSVDFGTQFPRERGGKCVIFFKQERSGNRFMTWKRVANASSACAGPNTNGSLISFISQLVQCVSTTPCNLTKRTTFDFT